ncbi:sulfatase [Aestuariivirga sp.]|uniref:sulfatase n=1 Tax=Aestuariivirga sp. TaxID=2650926 RepID=UPI003784151E
MLRRMVGMLASVIAGLIGLDVLPAMSAAKPNILFVVMDDVGIDQLELFGYGGVGFGPLAPPKTPTLDEIAQRGVRFANTMASPECSPSRVSFFTGRYPLRHNVMAAILPPDLAASQLSPYETTTPNILRKAGYTSALFGKSHFTNAPTYPQVPSTDPYQGTAVTQLGWDYFKGWYDGGPSDIDTTAGGIAAAGTYKCGYVPTKRADPVNGADSGACYKADNSCVNMSIGTGAVAPGLSCLASGGILQPSVSCETPPGNLNFNQQNGYYVSELVENPGQGQPAVKKSPADPASRGYRTTLEADFAIDWIKKQPKNKPWMVTVAFSAAHTPYQPAAPGLAYNKSTTLGNDCADSATESRALMTQMIEGVDRELKRILIETGIARKGWNGSLVYNSKTANTVVVVVADNGSFANNVRLPFDAAHSKGTVYQTGVWVPLIVAGPMVKSPNRTVRSMVNIVDLFQLFGDVAGVDVRKAVPATHGLDSKPLLPYLVNPRQDASPIRTTNFTQYGSNTRSTSHVDGACVVNSINTCTTLFPTKDLCEDGYGGTWYGEGTDVDIPEPYKSGSGLTTCCQVNQYLNSVSQPLVALLPNNSYGMRNQSYKLIRQTVTNIDLEGDSTLTADGANCAVETTDEFYRIDEKPRNPRLDRPTGDSANNLLPPGTEAGAGSTALSSPARENYDALDQALNDTLNSQKACPGDANLDALVNQADVQNQADWITITNGASTWWDLDGDGYTDDDDAQALFDLTANPNCDLGQGQYR